MDEAFKRGYETADLLSNPYPENSVEARRFVDGWVAGRKWYSPQVVSQTAMDCDG